MDSFQNLFLAPVSRRGQIAGWAAGLLLSVSVPAIMTGATPALERKSFTTSAARTVAAPEAHTHYGDLPLAFEPNVGQAGPDVQYLARTAGYTLFLTRTEAVMVLRDADTKRKPALVRMQLQGAKAQHSEPQGRQPGVSNYFIGHDPAQWHTDVPQYDRVVYRNVYIGVDVVYYGQHRQLEYDFVLQPGANPDQIRLAYQGVDSVRVDANGDLVLAVNGRELLQHKPVAYQTIAGQRVAVNAEIKLRGREVGFALARYDHRQPVVIDPVLSYSTYLGGSGLDIAQAIAVDANGSAYVVGQTASPNFPTANAFQSTMSGGVNAFVTKLSPAGNSIIYSTYIGDGVDASANGIAVDAGGNAYVTGFSDSPNFPIHNAAQSVYGGNYDAFALKLSAAGNSLVYSTYLGGSGSDFGGAIAVDGNGAAYIIGQTNSTNFPTVNALQGSFAGGATDVFVTKLSPAGNVLTYSTYLGGSTSDTVSGIAVDNSGSAYITGTTSSANFPVANAFQSTIGGGTDAFVAKLSANGSSLVYSTFLGGTNTETASGIAVDSTGSAYIGGSTNSTNFPTANAYRASLVNNATDAYVTKLSPTGNALVYSTYLGGSSSDSVAGIAVDGTGSAYIVGTTASTDFPIVNAFQTINASSFGYDAFVARLSASGNTLMYSSYLGGAGAETAYGIAIDAAGSAYVTGNTTSGNFPTVNPYQGTIGGNSDAFIARITPQPALNTSTNPANYNVYSAFTLPAGSTTVQTRAVSLTANNGASSYTSSVAGGNGAPVFVTVSPANGSLPATLTLTANPAGLAPNTSYTNTITFSAGNLTTAYAVTIFVEPANAASTNAKLSAYRGGLILFDANGDGTCCANDLIGTIGQNADIPLAGNWNGSGHGKSFGLYRPGFGLFVLDVNGNGTFDSGVDKALTLAPDPSDIPVVGDWTGTGVDRVGVFRGNTGTWYLDINGDGSFTGRAYLGQYGDIPLVGNWNGVGTTSKVGIYRPTSSNGQPGNFFLVDTNGDGRYTSADAPLFFLGQYGDVPLVGDWNGDGKSKVGVFRASGAYAGLAILDQNGNFAWDGPATDRVMWFQPYLTGTNTSTTFQPGDMVVTGDWAQSYGSQNTVNVVGRTRLGMFRSATGTFFLDSSADGTFQGRGFLGQSGDIPIGSPVLSNSNGPLVVVGVNGLGNF